jgi:hypothetical protein
MKLRNSAGGTGGGDGNNINKIKSLKDFINASLHRI